MVGSDRTEGESAFTDHSEGIACRRHEGGQRVVDIVNWTGELEGLSTMRRRLKVRGAGPVDDTGNRVRSAIGL